MSDHDDDVVAAATGAGSAIAVVGEGAPADRLRARLGAAAPSPGVEPDVIVVVSGRPDDLVDALGRVADLGTVILAGAAVQPTVAVDLYVDLHSRGITLIGFDGAAENG